MLTNERAELIGNYLTADKERAAALLALSPEEAVAKINAEGHDFTADEIEEFGKNLKAAAQADELDENALEDVSGGLATAAATVYLACVTIGVGLGTAAASKWKW